MVPGMGHCQGGPGTDVFDKIGALDRWVESGTRPQSIPASHMNGTVADRTRPLCAYPTVAHYIGTGSTDEARTFHSAPATGTGPPPSAPRARNPPPSPPRGLEKGGAESPGDVNYRSAVS